MFYALRNKSAEPLSLHRERVSAVPPGQAIGPTTGGRRGRAGQCPFISRFVECQNTSFIYRQLAFFHDAASSADEKRVYYAIRLEVTRTEGGTPLSMNPMRGGGPAAVCARERIKQIFSDLRRSHQTPRGSPWKRLRPPFSIHPRGFHARTDFIHVQPRLGRCVYFPLSLSFSW